MGDGVTVRVAPVQPTGEAAEVAADVEAQQHFAPAGVSPEDEGGYDSDTSGGDIVRNDSGSEDDHDADQLSDESCDDYSSSLSSDSESEEEEENGPKLTVNCGTISGIRVASDSHIRRRARKWKARKDTPQRDGGDAILRHSKDLGRVVEGCRITWGYHCGRHVCSGYSDSGDNTCNLERLLATVTAP